MESKFIELHSAGERIACNVDKIVFIRDDIESSAISVISNRRSQRRCIWVIIDEPYEVVLEKIKKADL